MGPGTVMGSAGAICKVRVKFYAAAIYKLLHYSNFFFTKTEGFAEKVSLRVVSIHSVPWSLTGRAHAVSSSIFRNSVAHELCLGVAVP